jgi:ribonuclease J
MRRRIRDSGIVVASIIVNGKAELVTNPLIVMPGLLDPKEDEDFLNSITREVAETLHKQRKQSKGRLLIDEIQECAKSAIRRILKHEINKSPIIIVNIGEID